jgi:hypothetical protein
MILFCALGGEILIRYRVKVSRRRSEVPQASPEVSS